MNPLIPISNYGQVRQGDLLLLERRRDGVVFPAIAKQVIKPGTEHEEVVIALARNNYFVMSMMLGGESWVKSVAIVPNGKVFSVTNSMEDVSR